MIDFSIYLSIVIAFLVCGYVEFKSPILDSFRPLSRLFTLMFTWAIVFILALNTILNILYTMENLK